MFAANSGSGLIGGGSGEEKTRQRQLTTPRAKLVAEDKEFVQGSFLTVRNSDFSRSLARAEGPTMASEMHLIRLDRSRIPRRESGLVPAPDQLRPIASVPQLLRSGHDPQRGSYEVEFHAFVCVGCLCWVFVLGGPLRLELELELRLDGFSGIQALISSADMGDFGVKGA